MFTVTLPQKFLSLLLFFTHSLAYSMKHAFSLFAHMIVKQTPSSAQNFKLFMILCLIYFL